MKITEYTHHKELRPDEGKVLTNGRGWATAVSMPLNADHSMWREIDQPEESEEIPAEEALDIILGQ